MNIKDPPKPKNVCWEEIVFWIMYVLAIPPWLIAGALGH